MGVKALPHMEILRKSRIQPVRNIIFFNADKATFYDPNSGINNDNQRKFVFKNNWQDPELNKLPKIKVIIIQDYLII